MLEHLIYVIMNDPYFVLWYLLGLLLGSCVIYCVIREPELIELENRICRKISKIRAKLRKNKRFMAWVNDEPVSEKKVTMPIKIMTDWRKMR